MRRRFADRRDLVRFVGVAVLRRHLSGWRAPADLLADPGDPFGAFAAGPLDSEVRVRVHEAVFYEWAPDHVGAAWDGAFVRQVHLDPDGRELQGRLADLLAHPALRRLEVLSIATRTDGSALAAAVAAADVPPTLRALRLRCAQGPLDLEPLAGRLPHLVDLELVGPFPVDDAIGAARVFAGSLRRLRADGRGAAADPPDVRAALPALRQLWLVPSPSLDLGADGIALDAWRTEAPLGGQVAWDEVLADAPGVGPDDGGTGSDEDSSGASAGSGSGPSGDPDPDFERFGPLETPLWDVEIDDVRGGLSPDEAFGRIRQWEPPTPPDAEDGADVPADGWWIDAWGRYCSTDDS